MGIGVAEPGSPSKTIRTSSVSSEEIQHIAIHNTSGTALGSDAQPFGVEIGDGTNQVQVAVHDSAAKANSIQGMAIYHSSVPSAVATGDAVRYVADAYGHLITSGAHVNSWNVTANYSTAQTATALKAAPGSGLRLYITDVVLSANSIVSMQLDDGDGTDVIQKIYFASNSSVSMAFRTPLKLTANKSLTFTSSGAVNHTVLISGFTAP